uniref:Phospholipase A2, group XIIB n=1 Tax=Hucho hucho TaxID=62062 RepID=A0A4W5K7C3_9TELE
MLPRISAFLLLSLCLSCGMSASLVRDITPEEEVPAAETMFRDDTVAAAATELFADIRVEADTVVADSLVVDDTPAAVDIRVEADTVVADSLVVDDTPAAVDIRVEADTVVADSLVVDDTPAVEEPVEDIPVAEDLVADKPVADTVVAGAFVAKEPVADSPVADAPLVDVPVMADEVPDTEALVADMPAVEDPAYMDLETLVEEDLITEAMIKELSAQGEKEDLAKETEIQDNILKDLADQEALEKAMRPIEEAAEAEAPAEDPASPVVPVVEAQEEDSDWGLASIRESLQAANGYFDSLVELMGGRNGLCQYKCKYGKTPVHRHGYVTPEPNGCSSDLLGFQLDMGIPAMTQCCNQLDSCYDTCGSNKNRCDSKYRLCLHAICSDLKKSLGLVSKVKGEIATELYSVSLYRSAVLNLSRILPQRINSLSSCGFVCSPIT